VDETDHGFRARLDAPAYGVATGQAVVLYEENVVVGAGAAVTPDRIVLTIPRDEGFDSVAQLVLAGVAARLNFSYEVVDDLGVALETVLERRGDADELTVELEVGADTVRAVIGPCAVDGLQAELEGPDDRVGLRRVLETVVDSFSAVEREGGEWIELEKRVQTVESAM